MSDFTGLIGDDFVQLHIDMMTEIISACSVECTAIYGVTLYDDCPNCVFDPIGNKSANRYQTGGPAPFTVGQCPLCAGAGKIANEQTETICLAPIYDYKSWIPGITSNVQSPYGFVQTLSMFDDTYDTIRQVKEIILDTSLDSHVKARFEKHGEPYPCGLGHTKVVVAMWKRIENG